jgi:cell division protein FtsA
MREQLLAGVDIGSTKTVVVLGQLDREGHLHILGSVVVPGRGGVRAGGITDIDEVANSLSIALERSSHLMGRRPLSVFCAMTGRHVESLNHRGAIAITPTGRDITMTDVARVLEVAGAIPLDANRMILAVMPRMYIIDGQDGVKNAVGMAGFRLEAEAHIVTGALSAYRNVLKCAERAHVEVEEVVVAALASAEAVLAPTERDLGTILIDLGGETADVAIFADGGLWRTFMLPLGGSLITDDIAQWLGVPPTVAEALKTQYGAATPQRVGGNETIDMSQFLPNYHEALPRQQLAEVIQARVEEMLLLLREEVQRTQRERLLTGGVVLTGGTAELPGISELAAQIFQAPVRIGAPHSLYGVGDTLAHPSFATAVGLLRWQQQGLQAAQVAGNPHPLRALWGRMFGGQ